MVSVLFHAFAFLPPFFFVFLLFILSILIGKKCYFKVLSFLMQFVSILNIRNLNLNFSDREISSVTTLDFIVIAFLIMVHCLILNKKIFIK